MDILVDIKSLQKLGILSLIRDYRKKSRETREVAYTCRYTSGHLILDSVYGISIKTYLSIN